MRSAFAPPVLAAAATFLAAACSLAPRHQRPEAPVPDAWPQAAADAGASAADLGWRELLGDERLRAVVALALENNRDLRVAALNVELARAQFRIQRAEQLPTVVATGSATRQYVGEDLSATGESQTTTRYTVGAGVTAFELDLFGRVRSLSSAALAQYLATEEARRSAHLALVSEVATQELSVRALEEEVALARQTLETTEAFQRLTHRGFEAGQRSELDLRAADAQVLTARVNLANAMQRRDQAVNALALLVGRPLPPDLPAAQPLDAPALVGEVPAGLPSDVLLRRPDVLAAEHQLRAANANIGAARAAFFPSITLTAFGGTASDELSGLFGGGSGTWSFTPQINLPIFAGGALRANLDAAHVRRRIEVARYERAVQNAFREVADALAARAALDAQLESQAALVVAEERRYQLSQLRYSKGVDSYLGVLTAQRDLFSARQRLIQTRLARLANLLELYRALGGGWNATSLASK